METFGLCTTLSIFQGCPKISEAFKKQELKLLAKDLENRMLYDVPLWKYNADTHILLHKFALHFSKKG